MMLNPGFRSRRTDGHDDEARDLINQYRASGGSLRALTEILHHFEEDSEGWNNGKFRPFYSSDVGLKFDTLAFANIAWCSTRSNKYPSEMLDACFERHTRHLLQILNPSCILLSRPAIRLFSRRIKGILPSAHIIQMPHYRWRKGAKAWKKESARIRRELSKISQACRA
jgi:hypothetical protein